jgi:hypothetical protein
MSFADAGPGSAWTLTLSKQSYIGAFHIDGTACASSRVVTLDNVTFNGPSGTATVTPRCRFVYAEDG